MGTLRKMRRKSSRAIHKTKGHRKRARLTKRRRSSSRRSVARKSRRHYGKSKRRKRRGGGDGEPLEFGGPLESVPGGKDGWDGSISSQEIHMITKKAADFTQLLDLAPDKRITKERLYAIGSKMDRHPITLTFDEVKQYLEAEHV